MTAVPRFASPKPWFSLPSVDEGFRLFVNSDAPSDTFLTALHGHLAGQDLDSWAIEFDCYEQDWICWKITPQI